LPGGILVMSLEEGDVYPFDLGPGQRFRHHPDVIANWFKRAGLEIISDQQGALRQEKGVSVIGRIVVARAASAIVSAAIIHDATAVAVDGDCVSPVILH